MPKCGLTPTTSSGKVYTESAIRPHTDETGVMVIFSFSFPCLSELHPLNHILHPEARPRPEKDVSDSFSDRY